MKVTLDKQIQLRSSIVYLRFEKEVNRKDIQEYLNGKRFENSLIENRIKEYLKNIKVFDEKYQLTRLGNAVKDSGMLPTVEEGKYQIWFTNEDSHFGNKIFYFKRVQPNRESNDDKINLKFRNHLINQFGMSIMVWPLAIYIANNEYSDTFLFTGILIGILIEFFVEF
jgi:hypothetical protein